jgi:hypothetical protein
MAESETAETKKVYFDEAYIQKMGIEELRENVRDWFQFQGELRHAIREESPMLGGWMLKMLGAYFGAKYPQDNAKGKALQLIYDDLPEDDPRRAKGQIRESRYKIPFKSECEGGAGLWWRIHRGLTGSVGHDPLSR